MSYQARTTVSHSGAFAHVPPARRRPVERSALHIPLAALGPVSDVIELYSENRTPTPPTAEPAGAKSTED